MATSTPPDKLFYDRVYSREGYADFGTPEAHFAYGELVEFISRFGLKDRRCLEVGCGRGLFQDLVDDYTGVDVSSSVEDYLHKPFAACDATRLPFDDCSFDAAWSITVLEHISHPEAALAELRRVLRPGGVLFLKPAWHCRQWNCEGIPVRPYQELDWRQRWIKSTLAVRESILVRSVQVIPRRLIRWLRRAIFPMQPRPLPFVSLSPDYETFWMADSDAAVSLDPFDVIVWFRERGDEVLSHSGWNSALWSRSESLTVRIQKPA